MYLLDTDTVSHLWAQHENVVENLRGCDDTEIGTTSITKSEILRARYENLLKANDAEHTLIAQNRLDRTEELLSEQLVVPFDEAAVKAFNRLTEVKKLKKIGRADLLIASIALANDATLVTRNLRHFRQVPNLKVENWVD